MDKKTWIGRVLSTALTILLVIFIFSNSLASGSQSSGHSGRLTALLNTVLSSLGLPGLTEHVVRKLAHFGEFALLGLSATWCLRTYTEKYLRHLSLPLLFGLLTAGIDETLQLFSSGRSSSVVDVWIDFGGVCAGMGFAVLLIWLCTRKK